MAESFTQSSQARKTLIGERERFESLTQSSLAGMTLKGEHEMAESFTQSSQAGTALKGENERAESFTQSSLDGTELGASSVLLQCTELSAVHTTSFYYSSGNYLMFTPQNFTIMHGTILCSRYCIL